MRIDIDDALIAITLAELRQALEDFDVEEDTDDDVAYDEKKLIKALQRVIQYYRSPE
jgi:hypothetical protein